MMSYIKTEFGTLENGTVVYRYTLTNQNGVSASFTDLGGVWLTMMVPDRNGNMADVVLGVDTVENLLCNPGHMGEIVGRNANRIGDAQFEINGVTYHLNKNCVEKHNLHSGLDFYRYRVWDTEVEDTSLGTRIVFSLLSPDGDQGYPGSAKIRVSYELTEDDSIIIQYHMTCDADTVANMTNHAYFNLAGHDSGNAMDQQVWIDADRFTVTDSSCIPTGELASVEGTPLDFRVMKPLAREIDAEFDQTNMAGGYDNNMALNHAPGQLSLAAKAYDEKSGRFMEVYTDLPGMQLYTANSMDTDKGKNGAHYGKRCSYCFESQYFPNNLNRPEFESSILRAGDVYETTTIYKFGAE